jgi:hypothetical protein
MKNVDKAQSSTLKVQMKFQIPIRRPRLGAEHHSQRVRGDEALTARARPPIAVLLRLASGTSAALFWELELHFEL